MNYFLILVLLHRKQITEVALTIALSSEVVASIDLI